MSRKEQVLVLVIGAKNYILRANVAPVILKNY
jgi:hypothetical protein